MTRLLHGHDKTLLSEVSFDPSTPELLDVAMAEAIATAAEVDALDLDPLYDVVDLEALTRIVARAIRGDRDDVVSISVGFDEWIVCLRSDGHLRVYDRPDEMR